MRRLAAAGFALLVATAAVYLGERVYRGLAFRTDLMALLPREEQDPDLARTKDAVVRAMAQRVVILLGHPDRDRARAAARRLAETLVQGGLGEVTTGGLDRDGLRQIGELYFPYRRGLLSESDRHRLEQARGDEIARRALAQVFGPVGMADAGILRHDPFLLVPAFLAELPLPVSRLSLDDGLLSTRAEGRTWVLVSARLAGEPFAVEFQRRFTDAFDRTAAELCAGAPGLEVLRLGAVFFARAGAEEALSEASSLGLASVVGTVLVVLSAFRTLTPLWQSLVAVGVGVLSAIALCLAVFGELHVAVLLFGVSLVGIAVDYSLHYACEAFSREAATPHERLARVIPGLVLGLATSVVGYGTFLLAPFPGLHQVALFSAVGLLAAFATVVLFAPALERRRPAVGRVPMLAAATRFSALWREPRYRAVRRGLILLLALLGAVGATRIHADDDVRRSQSLAPDLVEEQERIQRLIGATGATQFFLVEAPGDEEALRAQETLAERLHRLRLAQVLRGFHAPASFVPSAARQRENRLLVRERLDVPHLEAHRARLGLAERAIPADDSVPVLDLETAMTAPALASAISTLRIPGDDGRVRHVVVVEGVTRPDLVGRAADGVPGAHFVDMAGDVSRLLEKYRKRAVMLVAGSAALMLPLLAWRYGALRGLLVLAPPVAAAALTPALEALAGLAFTFFDAMALVLVLSIGVDYAIFCAETDRARMARTIVAIWLAAMTTILAFGLLSLSRVTAVAAFGSTMLLGILLAVLLAPLAAPRGERS